MKPNAGGLVALTALTVIVGAAVPTGSARGVAEPVTVDMTALLKAAQIDPRRADQAPTPGAGASVTAVERALRAEGLLAGTLVDGHYGTETVAAYAEFQRLLGYPGAPNAGLPGARSLHELGAGRFAVDGPFRPGERTQHDGRTVNARTGAMLAEAERRLGRALALDQGSYNPGGDPTSAGTHDGGGVVDISVTGMDETARTEVVRVLRETGFAAWDRHPAQGNWPQHIHAVAISDPDLSTPAQHQAGDYHLGRNGLANGAPDDGPEVRPIRSWEEHQHAH